MAGMLTPIPHTPLTERLRAEDDLPRAEDDLPRDFAFRFVERALARRAARIVASRSPRLEPSPTATMSLAPEPAR